MQIVKEFQVNNLVYDNANNQPTERSIELEDSIIIVNFLKIIDTQFSGGNVQEKFDKLKEYLHLGEFASAPCGGFLNFFEIQSSTGDMFILYSGVNEVENSHYIVTVHKIIKE